jgi:2',3'-cyclic-nucleotide 2'-phosphodiesterase/3'-nucleotidase
VDKVRGRVHGVPAVMANLWGKDLGVIGLRLRYDGQRWLVDRDATTVEVRSTASQTAVMCRPMPRWHSWWAGA